MTRRLWIVGLCLLGLGCSGETTAEGTGTITYLVGDELKVIELTEVKAKPNSALITITIPLGEGNCVFTADKKGFAEKYGEHHMLDPGYCTLVSESGETRAQIDSGGVDFQEETLVIWGEGRLKGDSAHKYDGPEFSLYFNGKH